MRNWHDRLEEFLWASRTTPHTLVLATLYFLIYRTKEVIQPKCQIPSLRQAIQEGITKVENSCLHIEELEFFGKKKLEAQQSIEGCQACLSHAFNKKFHLRSFKVGDQVLTAKKSISIFNKLEKKFA